MWNQEPLKHSPTKENLSICKIKRNVARILAHWTTFKSLIPTRDGSRNSSTMVKTSSTWGVGCWMWQKTLIKKTRGWWCGSFIMARTSSGISSVPKYQNRRKVSSMKSMGSMLKDHSTLFQHYQKAGILIWLTITLWLRLETVSPLRCSGSIRNRRQSNHNRIRIGLGTAKVSPRQDICKCSRQLARSSNNSNM